MRKGGKESGDVRQAEGRTRKEEEKSMAGRREEGRDRGRPEERRKDKEVGDKFYDSCLVLHLLLPYVPASLSLSSS